MSAFDPKRTSAMNARTASNGIRTPFMELFSICFGKFSASKGLHVFFSRLPGANFFLWGVIGYVARPSAQAFDGRYDYDCRRPGINCSCGPRLIQLYCAHHRLWSGK
jgi:hypothetical protein